MTWVETWPQQLQPLDENGQPDGALVEGYQLRPGGVEAFLAWSGGHELFANGGPLVLLPGTAPAASRIVGLGDFAVRSGTHYRAELADGFWQRYALAQPPNDPGGVMPPGAGR